MIEQGILSGRRGMYRLLWARPGGRVMGQSLQWHLGGGAGGSTISWTIHASHGSRVMKAPAIPNVTPELKQEVISGVIRAAGRTVDQLAQRKTEC